MKFDAEKALSHQIVLLVGSEHSLRRQVLTDLIKAAAGGDDFDIETFSADSSSPAEWIGSASTAPFLSPRRTAVIRNLLRLDTPSEFSDRFAGDRKLPESSLILLVADDETGDQARQSKLDRVSQQWEKAIKALGGYIFKLEVPPDTIIEQLRTEAKEAGKTLSLPAATLLKEMCGDSYSRGSEELAKLILFVGDAATITDQHVKEVVFKSQEWNVFKLTDSVLKRNSGEALRQLVILVGSGAKAEGAAFSSILPQLIRQFRLLYQARTLIDRGTDPSRATAEDKAMLPTKGSLLLEKDFPKKLAMQGARNLSARQIADCMQILCDTDARLKGALAGFSTRDTLERMILEMIRVLEPRRA